MNTNNNPDDLDPDNVESVVRYAIGDLLDLAAGVAELQYTKQGADDIWAMCDLIAEYYQIERSMTIRRDGENGVEYETVTFVGTNPYADYYDKPTDGEPPVFPGLNIRVIDAPRDSNSEPTA